MIRKTVVLHCKEEGLRTLSNKTKKTTYVFVLHCKEEGLRTLSNKTKKTTYV
jgi:hypothetical protein